MSSPLSCTLRPAVPDDAAAVAKLCGQLGYPFPSDEIRARLVRLTRQTEQLVLVALLNEEIAGLLQAHASETIETGFRVEIVGLVVDDRFRRNGIGRRLVTAAEVWAKELGAATVLVRSNVQREESHRFYPSLGFVATKNQTVYRKALPA